MLTYPPIITGVITIDNWREDVAIVLRGTLIRGTEVKAGHDTWITIWVGQQEGNRHL